MTKNRKIILGVAGVFIFLCGAFMLFVNWSNSDEGQASLREAETQDAITSANASTQAAEQAQAEADHQARLQNAKLVFEDGLAEGSSFLNKNIGDHKLSFDDGIAVIYLPWDSFFVWESGQTLGEFAAELDCIGYGSAISCGFAYSVRDGGAHYYAAMISGSANCGYLDSTSDFSVSLYPLCNYPHASQGVVQHLRLERFGNAMRFYVNGKLMKEDTLDKPEFFSGGVGLIFGRAGGKQSEINEVRIANFKVWALP